MRSAEAYFNMNKRLFDGAGYFVNEQDFKEAIREAQREAIAEAANVAKTTWDSGHKCIESAYVDKQSILQLLNQIQ